MARLFSLLNLVSILLLGTLPGQSYGESPSYSECRPHIDATIMDMATKAMRSNDDGSQQEKHRVTNDYGPHSKGKPESWQRNEEHRSGPDQQKAIGQFDKLMKTIFGVDLGPRDPKYARPWQTHPEFVKKPKTKDSSHAKIDQSPGIISATINKAIESVFNVSSEPRDPKWAKPWQTHKEHEKKSQEKKKTEASYQTKKSNASNQPSFSLMNAFIEAIFGKDPYGGRRHPKWAKPWTTHEKMQRLRDNSKHQYKQNRTHSHDQGGLVHSLITLVFENPDGKRDPKWAVPWQTHKDIRGSNKHEKSESKASNKPGFIRESVNNIIYAVFKITPGEREKKWAKPWQTHEEFSKVPKSGKAPKNEPYFKFNIINSMIEGVFGKTGEYRDPKWSKPWQTHSKLGYETQPPHVPKGQEKKQDEIPRKKANFDEGRPVASQSGEKKENKQKYEEEAPKSPKSRMGSSEPSREKEKYKQHKPASLERAKSASRMPDRGASWPRAGYDDDVDDDYDDEGYDDDVSDDVYDDDDDDDDDVDDDDDGELYNVKLKYKKTKRRSHLAEDDDDQEDSLFRSRDHIQSILGLDADFSSSRMASIADATLKELKKVFEGAVKPLESTYKYQDISNRHLSDAELFGTPLILLIGPYSTGKSTFINYLLGTEFSDGALKTGAPPSHGVFRIIGYGEKNRDVDGTDLSGQWAFSFLQKFGQNFVDQLLGKELNSPLLKRVTIVEAPGILEMRRAGERQYPFNDVVQWFIDRADLVLIMFDYTKLDAGFELEAILDQLKGRESQTRILLNKADHVPPEELIKVQGSLFWNLSPLLGMQSPPVVYAGSFSSYNYRSSSPKKLFQAQEEALLHDIAKAINSRVENRIAIVRRHAVRVRNHAQMVDSYLSAYYKNKGFLTSKHKLVDEIVENPHAFNIYEGVSLRSNVSRYDLPDPEIYSDFFKVHNLYNFKTLRETCSYLSGCPLTKLDTAISKDLPELLARYRRQNEAASPASKLPDVHMHHGGARRDQSTSHYSRIR